VIDDPVQLADIMPTILRWAGAAVPEGLAGRPLPVVADAGRVERAVIVEQFDFDGELAPDADPLAVAGWQVSKRRRRFCTPEDRVFGDMRALIRYPYKFIWYANYPAELYDLSVDGQEERDLAPEQPALVSELAEDLARLMKGRSPSAGGDGPPAKEVLPPQAVVDRLRVLGYLAGEGPGAPRPPAPAR